MVEINPMNNARRIIDVLATQPREMFLSSRSWLRLAMVYVVLGISAFFMSGMGNAGQWWVHGVWCASGLVIALPVLVKMFRSNFALMLIDHRVMFTAAFALYFLYGAMFLWLGQEDEIAESLRYYPIDATAALRVDAVNSIGFGLALIASSLSSGRWLGAQADYLSTLVSRVPAPWAMVMLMAIGLLSSLYVLAVDLAIRPGIISGIWRSAANFILVVILLSSSYAGRYQTSIRLTGIGIALIQCLVGVLMFNKSSVLLPLGCVVAGLSIRYGSRRILLPGLLMIGLVLLSITSVVGYGRNNLDLQSDSPIPLAERWSVLKEGIVAVRNGGNAPRGDTWGRLSYTVPQGAAMEFYESNAGGNDLRLIPWAFVPRVLVPDKPVMTDSGRELHEKVTGNTLSSTGVGIFISGYYNAGWVGLVFASVLCGWLLGQTSAIAHAILARRALMLLPLAMLGVFMAFRIDGHFVSDYFGAFVFILYPLLGTAVLRGLRR